MRMSENHTHHMTFEVRLLPTMSCPRGVMYFAFYNVITFQYSSGLLHVYISVSYMYVLFIYQM